MAAILAARSMSSSPRFRAMDWLEVTILLELALGKFLEAVVIAILLAFNAALSLFQETRARGALALLQQRLAVQSKVLRDGIWRQIPAEQLVVDDFVHLQMGDLVPADIDIQEGLVLLDQAALTGESVPIEVESGQQAYAGALVKRGGASGNVGATGSRTYFGQTAELVRSARTVSHLESIIFSIVKYLVAMDTALAAGVFLYAAHAGMPLSETLPFVLILLVASVPVALPATFTWRPRWVRWNWQSTGCWSRVYRRSRKRRRWICCAATRPGR